MALYKGCRTVPEIQTSFLHLKYKEKALKPFGIKAFCWWSRSDLNARPSDS